MEYHIVDATDGIKPKTEKETEKVAHKERSLLNSGLYPRDLMTSSSLLKGTTYEVLLSTVSTNMVPESGGEVCWTSRERRQR